MQLGLHGQCGAEPARECFGKSLRLELGYVLVHAHGMTQLLVLGAGKRRVHDDL